MRRAFGAIAVALTVVVVGIATRGGVAGDGRRSAHAGAALPAGSAQFVIAAADLASGERRIGPNCYLPAGHGPRSTPATAAPTHLPVWRLVSNPWDTTITTPPEATSSQNSRVLSCLRGRGFAPQVRVGSGFRTD
jgi:hypothetical protein